MIDTASILDQFRAAASVRGLRLPDHIDADGKLHRCELRDGPARKLDGGKRPAIPSSPGSLAR